MKVDDAWQSLKGSRNKSRSWYGIRIKQEPDRVREDDETAKQVGIKKKKRKKKKERKKREKKLREKYFKRKLRRVCPWSIDEYIRSRSPKSTKS
jgi:hypothetical protein